MKKYRKSRKKYINIWSVKNQTQKAGRANSQIYSEQNTQNWELKLGTPSAFCVGIRTSYQPTRYNACSVDQKKVVTLLLRFKELYDKAIRVFTGNLIHTYEEWFNPRRFSHTRKIRIHETRKYVWKSQFLPGSTPTGAFNVSAVIWHNPRVLLDFVLGAFVYIQPDGNHPTNRYQEWELAL